MSCIGCSCRPSDTDPGKKACSRKVFGGFLFNCDPDCCNDCNALPTLPRQLNPAGISIVNAPVETGTSLMTATVSDELPIPRIGAPFEESRRVRGTQSLRDVLIMGEKIKPGEFTIESFLKLALVLAILFVTSTVIIFA